jgi:hypothetical protein
MLTKATMAAPQAYVWRKLASNAGEYCRLGLEDEL